MSDIHVRQQVRNNLATLVGQVTDFDGHVFLSRASQLGDTELPAAIVLMEGETIENQGSNRPAFGIQKRTIVTSVYVFVKSPTLIEDKLDALCAQVEQQVFTDSTLQGVASQTTIESVEPYIHSSPTLPTGAFRILFSSIVYTKEGDPYKALQQ